MNLLPIYRSGDLPGFLLQLRGKLSQEEVAKLVDRDRTTIGRYENGKSCPKEFGYLAFLAQRLVCRQEADKQAIHEYQKALLKEIIKVRHYYYPTAPEIQDWDQLYVIACDYAKNQGVALPPKIDSTSNISSLPLPESKNTASPPDNFIQRPHEFEQLKTLILQSTEPNAIIALQGGGGFGKTTLAQAICHDPGIQADFPDAILWVEVGQEPDVPGLLREQIELLGEAPTGFSTNALVDQWRKALTGRKALLVLDDVWDDKDVRPFLPHQPGCVVLITTRRLDIVSRLRAQDVTVNEMSPAEATRLLEKELELSPDERPQLQALADDLGNFSLLLSLVGGYLHELIEYDGLSLEAAIAEWREDLRKRGITYLDKTDLEKRFSATLEVSLERLREYRDRYLELAVFPRNAAIPLVTMEKLWNRTANLNDSKRAYRAMHRLSLFREYNPTEGFVRLHDILSTYLHDSQKDSLPTLHAHLLDVHAPVAVSPRWPAADSPTWADLPDDEPYMWDHLVHHLVEAGRGEALFETLKDWRYLITKCHLRRAQTIERDLRLAQDWKKAQKQEHDILFHLQQTLAQRGYLLNRCESLNDVAATLYALLHARLQDQSPINQYLKHLKRLLPANVIVPRHPFQPHPALHRTLEGHQAGVIDCRFSPDGQRLLSLDYEGHCLVWNVETGEIITRSTIPISEARRWWKVFIQPDGRSVIWYDGDRYSGKKFIVWNIEADREEHHIVCEDVSCWALSLDGRYICAVNGNSTNLKILDLETKETLSVGLKGFEIWGCAISSKGHILLYDGSIGYLYIQNLEKELEEEIPGFDDPGVDAHSFAFSPDGRYLVYAADDGFLEIRQVDDTDQARRLTEGYSGEVENCGYTSDGAYIWTAFEDATLKLWEAQTNKTPLILTGHSGVVNACAYNGRYLVSASGDTTLKVWDMTIIKENEWLVDHSTRVTCCAFSPDGQFLVTGSEDGVLKLWDTSAGQVLQTLGRHSDEAGNTSGVYACAYSPDGKAIVSASYKEAIVWEVHTGEKLHTLSGHTDWIVSCAYSPDGRFILTAGHDGTVKIWDAYTKEYTNQALHLGSAITCGAFSPDGDILLTLYDETPQVRNIETDRKAPSFSLPAKEESADIAAAEGENVDSNLYSRFPPPTPGGFTKQWGEFNDKSHYTFERYQIWAKCAYSPDGRYVISVTLSKSLTVWDTHTGQDLLTLSGHSEAITGCAYSPDGRLIATVSADKTLKIWQVSAGDNGQRPLTGRCLTTFPVERALNACAWSPDGQYLTIVGDGGVQFLRYRSNSAASP